jgi:hypothetical protein
VRHRPRAVRGRDGRRRGQGPPAPAPAAAADLRPAAADSRDLPAVPGQGPHGAARRRDRRGRPGAARRPGRRARNGTAGGEPDDGDAAVRGRFPAVVPGRTRAAHVYGAARSRTEHLRRRR